MPEIKTQNNLVKFGYDYDHDVLHLYYGETKLSDADEPAHGIYVKYAEADNSFTGAVILDFKKRTSKEINSYLPVTIDFDDIKQQIQ